jgi:uncharacterized membrane protein
MLHRTRIAVLSEMYIKHANTLNKQFLEFLVYDMIYNMTYDDIYICVY